MRQVVKQRYLETDYIGYYSGFGGIEIKSIRHGDLDYVIFVANAWYGKKSVHKARIYYGNRPYFRYNGNRIYFDECLRRGI